MLATIVISVLLITIVVSVYYFNRLVVYRNRMKNAWSDIDVQLKRRSDLIPPIVETVKAYAAHEKTLFENISRLRSESTTGEGAKVQTQIQQNLADGLRKLFVVVENYPGLLADQNFRNLQENLAEIEDTLQMARRYYNAVVRDNNTLAESFPGIIFARVFGFSTGNYFEAEALEREVIMVRFSS